MTLSAKIAGLKAITEFDNWPLLVIQRIFDRNAGLLVYRKNGLEILVDHRGGDENGTRECITSDMYRKYVRSMSLPDKTTVLDLGANGGGFPLMLFIEGVRLGHIVCVEMNTATYLRLAVNLATNLGPAAVAINGAVCGMIDGSEIQIEPVRGSTSTGIWSSSARAGGATVAVRTTTLQALYDTYFKGQSIDLCKIDIEGAEYEVFDSSADSLLQNIRYLLIEFHNPEKTTALVQRIQSLGFTEMTPADDHTTGPYTEVRGFRGKSALGTC
jgi:FkbM family methyltransferase